MQHTVRGGGYLAPTERQPCYFDSKVKELWEKLPQIALARSILRPRVARAPDVPGSSKPARFRGQRLREASILKRQSQALCAWKPVWMASHRLPAVASAYARSWRISSARSSCPPIVSARAGALLRWARRGQSRGYRLAPAGARRPRVSALRWHVLPASS